MVLLASFGWVVGIIAATMASVVLGVAAFGWLYRRRAQIQLHRLSRGKLVLTFDDGPSIKMTPMLIEVLSRYGAKATFFLLGSRAQAAPHLCDELVRRGHELATHGDQHLNAWKCLPHRVGTDIRDGYAALNRWVSPRGAFRPPFGKLTLFSWMTVRRLRAPVVFWTLDSKDSWPMQPLPPETVVEQLLHQRGGIVLLHCHNCDEHRIEYALTVTELLLKAAAANDLTVCTVSELLSGSTTAQTAA